MMMLVLRFPARFKIELARFAINVFGAVPVFRVNEI